MEPLQLVNECLSLIDNILALKTTLSPAVAETDSRDSLSDNNNNSSSPRYPKSPYSLLWPEVEMFRKPLISFRHLENKQLEPKVHGFHKLIALLDEIKSFLEKEVRVQSHIWSRTMRNLKTVLLYGGGNSDSEGSVSGQVRRFRHRLKVLTPYVFILPVIKKLFDHSQSVDTQHSQQGDDPVCELYYKARVCGDFAALLILQSHAAAGNPLARCFWNALMLWGDVPGLTKEHQLYADEVEELHLYLLEQAGEVGAGAGAAVEVEAATSTAVAVTTVTGGEKESLAVGGMDDSARLTIDTEMEIGIGRERDAAETETETVSASVPNNPNPPPRGHAFANLLLGMNYELGIGVKQNWEQAFRYYKRASDQESTLARYNVGRLLEKGLGTPKNIDDAVGAYISAANKGHAMAQYAVGRCFMKGIGGEVDLYEAKRYCQLASDQGYGLAQCGLGHCYEKGLGVSINLQEAVRLYKLSADQGHSDAKYAQFNLGKCYEKGIGVKADLSQAFRYYKLAADSGHVRAQWTLGFMYENGHGVGRDAKKAVIYYTMSADAGHAASQTELAGMYMWGIRVPKDEAKAAKYFLMAANQGNAAAQYEIGCCYKNGTGVEEDREEAVKWFKRSAAQGNNLARNRISDMRRNRDGKLYRSVSANNSPSPSPGLRPEAAAAGMLGVSIGVGQNGLSSLMTPAGAGASTVGPDGRIKRYSLDYAPHRGEPVPPSAGDLVSPQLNYNSPQYSDVNPYPHVNPYYYMSSPSRTSSASPSPGLGPITSPSSSAHLTAGQRSMSEPVSVAALLHIPNATHNNNSSSDTNSSSSSTTDTPYQLTPEGSPLPIPNPNPTPHRTTTVGNPHSNPNPMSPESPFPPSAN